MYSRKARIIFPPGIQLSLDSPDFVISGLIRRHCDGNFISASKKYLQIKFLQHYLQQYNRLGTSGIVKLLGFYSLQSKSIIILQLNGLYVWTIYIW